MFTAADVSIVVSLRVEGTVLADVVLDRSELCFVLMSLGFFVYFEVT